MKKVFALLCLALLAACQEESAEKPQAIALTESSVGHFCQMNMLEHPGPKAQVHLEGLPGAPLFFSQVRDAVAYLRMPEQSHEITAIYVNDMGRAPSWDAPGKDNWIAASAAHYVIGSARIGGMGAPELVPFGDIADAREFAEAHGGRVTALKDIPDSFVLAPVEAADPETDDDDIAERLRALSTERMN